MKIAVVKNTPDNIFAVFGDDITHYNKPPTDLRKKLYSSNLIKQKNYEDVFITTYLSSKQKSYGSQNNPDIENILLFNLRPYGPINNLISMANKIIIQGMDNINNRLPTGYPHYYFYGVFNNNIEEYTKYILYGDCNCEKKLFLNICDYLKLFAATRNKRQILNQISQNTEYNFPKNIVHPNKKFYLKIKINSNFFPENVSNLKKLIDIIVVFCNEIGVIATKTNKSSVNGNGYNPTDDLLYYCEIEKVDNKETEIKKVDNKETENDINFYVCPIFTSDDENKPNYFCEEKQDSVKNFPGLEKEMK